jgi:Nucleotidyltransferase domain
MTRDRWIEKIRGFIARVEAGDAPARVREIYCFGSFARGALEPNDLDLIIVHDPPSPETLAPLLKAVKSYSYDECDQAYKAYCRFLAAMRKVFRRGSERMDIKLEGSLDRALSAMVVPTAEVRLLWSDADRDWEGRVAAISPDAEAGRFPRNYFIDVKKAGCSRNEVVKVTEMIEAGILDLRRVCLDQIDPELNGEFKRWCDHWTGCRLMGAQSLKLLPWAMWWIQEQGGKRPHPGDRTEVWDERMRFRAAMGSFSLAYMLELFTSRLEISRQCLIPHLKVRETNWMYVFQRGKRWKKGPAPSIEIE